MKQNRSLHEALRAFDVVYRVVRSRPELELARSADDVERIHRSGRIASLIGVEGGHMIEGSLAALRIFHELGARYLTLTHWDNVEWADAATDRAEHDGLTEFGESVIREMNRLGMFVVLSHVRPDTMRDALRVSRAPVIFSHSNARAKGPHPRNVPDDVLRLLPQNGGVVHVNFIKEFVSPADPEWQQAQARGARGAARAPRRAAGRRGWRRCLGSCAPAPRRDHRRGRRPHRPHPQARGHRPHRDRRGFLRRGDDLDGARPDEREPVPAPVRGAAPARLQRGACGSRVFVLGHAWSRFGAGDLGDFCREYLGRSGRWLRDLAELGSGLEKLPGLEAAVLGSDGGAPLGRVAARCVAKTASPETLAAWVALARRVPVRELLESARAARRAGSARPLSDALRSPSSS